MKEVTMTMLAEELTITEMTIPADLDAADAGDFHAVVELNNTLCLLEIGVDDLNQTAQEMLPSWSDQTDRTQVGFIARRAGEIAGAALFSCANEPGAVAAEVDILVLPQNWGRGAEETLLERVQTEAIRRGRTSLQVWTLHRAQPDERMLTPATGWGHVPATALSDLLVRSGFSLEQVERNSAFDLARPLDPVEIMLEQAIATAGDDYRVVSWTLPTPEHLRDGYADVISRMATDVPSGDLDIDEEAWDADRIARRDVHFQQGGQLVSVAAVEHTPTGRLVAFNELVIGSDRTGVTHQYGTLVLKEHRGHRLGTIVKCANLLRWHDLAPHSPKVSTFNAEENRAMLDINEKIGFVPVSYAGAWKKILG